MKKKSKILLIFILSVLTVFMLAGCVTEKENITVNLPENYPTTEIIVDKMLTSNVIVESVNDTDGGRTKSKGSGVILTEDGYILTNKHVISTDKTVASMKKADITVYVMRDDYVMVPYSAEYIEEKNTDKFSDIDLAILKINPSSPQFSITPATPLNAVELGSVDAIKYGTPAIVVGNPKGLGIMVSSAMVSSPEVFLQSTNKNVYTYIAINSDVNSGNSGGGIYDYAGKLIGIVTLREVDESDNNSNVVLGIGYAIRIDEIQEYLKAYNIFGSNGV